jgi:hypothetical protein
MGRRRIAPRLAGDRRIPPGLAVERILRPKGPTKWAALWAGYFRSAEARGTDLSARRAVILRSVGEVGSPERRVLRSVGEVSSSERRVRSSGRGCFLSRPYGPIESSPSEGAAPEVATEQ